MSAAGLPAMHAESLSLLIEPADDRIVKLELAVITTTIIQSPLRKFGAMQLTR